MRVKKFLAKDMAEAMRMVKTELGPNAVILHSRDLRRGLMGWFNRGGVEVTAGVDLKQPPPSNKPAGGTTKPQRTSPSNGNKRGERLDVRVSDDSEFTGSEPVPLLGNAQENPLLSKPDLIVDNPLLALSRKIVEENANNKSGISSAKLPQENSKPPGTEKKLEERLMNLENRLIKLTGLIESLAPSIVPGDASSAPAHTRNLYNHLLEQDVDEHLALSIATHIAETTDEKDDVWTALKSHLISKIPIAAPIELNAPGGKPKTIMLVGPTGVGKTTTLAKISAQYRYNPETRTRPKIVFITADLFRLAAVEQLQKYTEILGVDLEVTYSPDEVRQSMKKHQDAHLILFDTAGTCQRNLPQMSTLAAIVEASCPDEVHLVLSATTKFSDMVDIVEHFKEIKPTRLLFTKIDESTTYGPILNTVSKFKMPISYLTTGQNVPEDIERARPDRIAKMLLTKPIVNRAIEDFSSPNSVESGLKNDVQSNASLNDSPSIKPESNHAKQD